MASKRPDSDVWNIVDNDEMSQHYGRNFKFDFSYISSDEIKELFKDLSLIHIYNFIFA